MIGADSIKHQARNIAWRYGDGDNTNYNPFARRSRSYVGRHDEEEGLQRRHTADQVPVDTGNKRLETRSVDEADFAYPHHANTAPPDSGSSSEAPTSNGTLVGQSDLQPVMEKETLSMDRDASRSIPDKRNDESEHKPRKRLALMNLLGQSDRTKTNTSELERSDTTDTSDTKKRRPKISIGSQLKATLLGSWVNILLVCVPIGFALRYSHSNGYAVFIVNFVAIVPLAAMLSFATEELAMYTGETLGGLLNASFGNATELIGMLFELLSVQSLMSCSRYHCSGTKQNPHCPNILDWQYAFQPPPGFGHVFLLRRHQPCHSTLQHYRCSDCFQYARCLNRFFDHPYCFPTFWQQPCRWCWPHLQRNLRHPASCLCGLLDVPAQDTR